MKRVKKSDSNKIPRVYMNRKVLISHPLCVQEHGRDFDPLAKELHVVFLC